MEMEPPEEAWDNDRYIARRRKWLGGLGTNLKTLITKVEGDKDAEVALMIVIGALKTFLSREHLWLRYNKRIHRIRKTSTITKDDILDAELKYETNIDQAEHLGITPRHLSRLRKKLF